jgi:hypothetical protein
MKLPQLSLRELFLLVVIAAMGCGWWVDRWQLNAALEVDRDILLKMVVDAEMKHGIPRPSLAPPPGAP